ncbi:AAA ATPase-like protein [Saccharothrix saharensis]|uniref:AAA ATPase-like protein n=1 Tax=Saccharothrix saharensis TaxID=571190 RepID=A0A543J624_9PSEU|nr:AAA family ATPase [Saccharothrix saharensis]TQM78257.1 AAA ATPase-like protein [Saccharothrix saharensis]
MKLIGRDHAVGVLRAEVERAVGSHGGLVLVAGEAGIGKTALVTAVAEQARRLGALVLGGSCWDSDSAPGYWPWVQVIRALRRAVTAEEWGEVGSGPLAVLLGEAPSEHTPESFPLYDAVTSALVSASRHRLVVVVLEDLHWADPASVKLLEFAAQHTWFERVLLVGTYRDNEVDGEEHPLRPLLSRAATVALAGLSSDEVGELMARTAGREPAAGLVAEVHRRTGGNPFFVEQTARLWHGGGPVTAVAPGVRDALRRRLSLLPGQVGGLLTTAAVLGREFHRKVLAATASLPVPVVDRLLDQAAQARLVLGSGGGRFSFAHDLVRETLYAALSDVDERHAAVVCALDGELAEHVLPADLARHAYLAGGRVAADRAVDLIVAAARDASRRMAVEEAAGHYRRALERAEGRRRIAVALELGNELYHCAEPVEARRIFEEAAAQAREVADPGPFAQVALAVYRFAEDEGRAGGLVREAYGRLIGPPPDVPTEVLAREMSLHATEAARGGGDDDALVSGLWAVHDTTMGIGNADQRLALTDELISVSRRSGSHTVEHFATSFRWVALVELGDPRYIDQVHAFVALSERLGMTRFHFSAAIDQSIIAAMQGRFAEAEALLAKATEMGASSHAGFRMMYLHLRWAFLVMRGEFAAVDALAPEILASSHPFPGLLAGIAALERGDVATARLHVEDDRHQPAFEPLWLRFLAQFAHAAGDRELAVRVRERLAPHRGKWLVSLYGCDVSGPVDLWLGVVDLALDRYEEAVEELGAAQRSAERMRARPWAERARRYLADVPAPTVVRDVEFRRDGDVWALSYDGVTVRMPDSKGLRDLHVLVSSPGEPVAAVALLAPEAVASARLGGDPVLDDEAKARYRRRLARLDEEIDHAVDDERAAALDRERAALLDELRAAAGLAGRTRRLGDDAERARKAVTARIRDALRKLDGRHPGLAAHLRETVSTGATCVYSGHLRL